MTSSWLKQHTGDPDVVDRKQAGRRQLATKKTRNLSSAGKGTVRSVPVDLSYLSAPPPSGVSKGAAGYTRVKGINSCSQLQELPNGYFNHADLWLTRKQDKPGYLGDLNISNGYNGIARNIINMNVPLKTTLTRSRSANQRTLGVTRSTYTYKRCPSIDSHLADINQWRALTPDYNQTDKHFNFNKLPESKAFSHYFGQTRINLEDPAGLFYSPSQNDQLNGPFAKYSQPVHVKNAFEKTNNGHNENLVLVKNARKLSSNKALKREENTGLICPIGQPYDYRNLSPRSQILAKRAELSSNAFPKSINSKVKLNNLSQSIDHPRASVLHQYSAFEISNSGKNKGIKGLSLPHSLSAPELDQLHSGMASVKDESSSTSVKSDSSLTSAKSESSLISLQSGCNDCISVADAESAADQIFSSLGNGSKHKPQFYIPTGAKQCSEDLSVSQLFVLRVDKKQQSPKRSVRFKIKDVVHEYEPWAPVKT